MIDALAAAGALDPLDVRFAEAVARLGPCSALTPLGAAVVSRAWTAGHACLDLAEAGDMLLRELAAARAERGEQIPELPPLPDAASWAAALAADRWAVRSAADDRHTPLVLDGSRLYVDRAWRQETALVTGVADRAGAARRVREDRLAGDLEALFPSGGLGIERQRAAAEAAVRRGFTVVSGGPGTGKTATVARVLALLVRQARALGERDPAVVMVAPTGKAAARLSESIRMQAARLPPGYADGVPSEASTVHRALDMRPGSGATRKADDPLRADVVVVDESSMVDLALMAALLDAVPPQARLILLGDPHQLAPVEAGSVLGDLCAAAAGGGALGPAVITLDHSWRFPEQSDIGRLARAVHVGDADLVAALLDDPALPAVTRVVLREGAGPAELEAHLRPLAVEAHRRVVGAGSVEGALQAVGAFRVLCAHRRGGFGVESLNPRIERWLAEHGLARPGEADYAGRPVMVLVNDDRIRLYNGDTGVLWGPPGRLRACFGEAGAIRDLAPTRLPRHETVYASTVHKSQGSEHDHVVVVLPSEPSPIVTRELLYTAVTRARTHVTVIGADEVLRQGVRAPVRRFSGLRDRLR
jgi:exodeoxyribonuclease V alpha subunit